VKEGRKKERDVGSKRVEAKKSCVEQKDKDMTKRNVRK